MQLAISPYTQMTDIERRKSVRHFNGVPLTESEISGIEGFIRSSITPLFTEIPYTVSIFRREETSCPRGEYCLCLYTDRKAPGALLNAGYIMAQLDLFLSRSGIGTCFYGFGRLKKRVVDGLEFTLMLDIGHSNEIYRTGKADRTNMFTSPFDSEVERLSSLSPSACNSQPWHIEVEGSTLSVTRGEGRPSMLKGAWKSYFNRIDVGIFLHYLELSLAHENYTYCRSTIRENDDYTIVYRTRKQ